MFGGKNVLGNKNIFEFFSFFGLSIHYKNENVHYYYVLVVFCRSYKNTFSLARALYYYVLLCRVDFFLRLCARTRVVVCVVEVLLVAFLRVLLFVVVVVVVRSHAVVVVVSDDRGHDERHRDVTRGCTAVMVKISLGLMGVSKGVALVVAE